MGAKQPDPTMKIELVWDTRGKRWKIIWWNRSGDGRSVSSHWRWIEVDQPLDSLNARRLIDAVRREMESWLTFDW